MVDIEKANFGDRQHETYRIKCPGRYVLKENISFCPKTNSIAAIEIDSSDVILDLNGKTLKQSKHSNKTQITGIIVKSQHKNVTILGSYGVIRNFSQRGLYVEGGVQNISIGDDTLLTIKNNGYGTTVSFLDGNQGVIQCGMQLGDMVFMAWNEVGTYNGLIKHLRVTNVLCQKNSCGALLGDGVEYFIYNSSFSENYDYRLVNPRFTAPNLGAFYIANSVITFGLLYISNSTLPPKPDVPYISEGIKDITFQKCKFTLNFADGSKPTNGILPVGAYSNGFQVGVDVKNLKIKNCQFNTNKSEIPLFNVRNNALAGGCVISSGETIVIEDSEFSLNKGGYLTYGLNINGLIASGDPSHPRSDFPAKSVTLRNCVASNNISTFPVLDDEILTKVDISASGFRMQYPEGMTMIDCVAENNRIDLRNYAVPSDITEINCEVFGILLYSDVMFCNTFTNNVDIRGAKLSKNRTISPYVDITFGSSSGMRIFDDLTENIVVQHSTITNNTAAFCEPILDSEKFQSIGIDIFNKPGLPKTGPCYISLLKNVIQSNGTFGVVTNMDNVNIEGNKVMNHEVGINLQECFYCSVIDNFLTTNGLAIADHNDPTTNLVAGNKGYNNDQFYCHYVADICTPGDVPVDSGILTNFPPPPSVSWSNTSINVPEGIPGPVYSCCDCETGLVTPCEIGGNKKFLRKL